MDLLAEACTDAGRKCLSVLERDESALREWLASEGWLLERYQELLLRRKWLEIAHASSAIARVFPDAYGVAAEVQKLHLARAWLLAGQGASANVAAILDADARFWRHVLARSDTILTKMMAVAFLRRNFAWGNLVLRRLGGVHSRDAVPDIWREPITDAERSMRRPLTGEWMFTSEVIRNADFQLAGPDGIAVRALSSLLVPLFQPQDTINKNAALLTSIADTLDVPWDRYADALQRVNTLEQEVRDSAFPPGRIYNILGDLLMGMATMQLTSYAANAADLEGIRRATLVAVKLRGDGIPKEDIPSHIVSQERDPYTGEPFEWDSGQEQIIFSGLATRESGYPIVF